MSARTKTKQAATVLQLVPPAAQKAAQTQQRAQVLSYLRHLLAQAEAGRLTGLSCVACYDSWQFETVTVGMLEENPLHTLGMVRILMRGLEDKALDASGG